jgi:predicted ATPase
MATQAQASQIAQADGDPAAGEPRWQVRLLGAVQAFDGVQRIERFPSRAGAALLARLALAPQQAHAREELVELLWPGVDLAIGRNRLRQTLSALKSLLEPADQPGASVLQADRLHVRVVPGALGCDVRDFEQLARSGQVDAALALYGGDLMPGYYDDWIIEERGRLAALRERLQAAPSALPRLAAPPARRSTAADTAGAEPSGLRLPGYLTRLFGVELAAARLRAMLLSNRLVSLLGPGGSGKTRLAVEVASALREVPGWSPPGDAGTAPAAAASRFDGVAFVPLVNCSSAPQMADAIAAALRLPGGAETVGSGPADRLVGALAGRRMLLVLDNLEQLVGAAAPLVAQLLAQLPGLHLLVTSRHALEVDGERCVQVDPLPLPATGSSLEDAAANPAVALFVDRARAVRSDFHLGPRNHADIVTLVRALQGMPLAIELAAARIRSFAPRDMAQRLQPTEADGFGSTPGLDLLARGGPRAGLDARHASMQRTVEWSWKLLSPGERELLCALTIFRGGCSAEAVRALQSGADTLLLLDALVAHSLVAAPMAGDSADPARSQIDSDDDDGASGGGATRFFLYEPIREFAAARLSAAQALPWRARHRAWMLDWAQALPVTPSLAAVRAEMPNLEAALASALADGDPASAVHLLLRLRRVLEDVELPASAMLHAEAAVAHCPDPLLRCRGQSLLGPLLLLAGRGEAALAAAQAGLDGLQGLSTDPALLGRALHALARVRWRSERVAVNTLPLLDAAEPLALAVGDLELQAGLLALRAFVFNRSAGDHGRARALHEQALDLWQRLGNRHAVHSGLYNLAVTEQLAGRNEDALLRLAQLEGSARQLHDWRRLSQAANVAGNALCDLRRWPQAADALRQALRLAWRTMAPYELAYPLWNLPRALAHLRQPELALQLAAFAAQYWERGFGKLTAADQRDLLRVRRLAARQIELRRIEAAWAQGAALSLGQAVALALGAPEEARTQPG